MSFSSFFIKYAWFGCTEEQVTDVFNSILGEGTVDNVKSCEKTDHKTGAQFKLFWINLKKNSPEVERIVAKIKAEEFIKVEYTQGWHWKVYINIPKEKATTATTTATKKFTPRIMASNE